MDFLRDIAIEPRAYLAGGIVALAVVYNRSNAFDQQPDPDSIKGDGWEIVQMDNQRVIEKPLWKRGAAGDIDFKEGAEMLTSAGCEILNLQPIPGKSTMIFTLKDAGCMFKGVKAKNSGK